MIISALDTIHQTKWNLKRERIKLTFLTYLLFYTFPLVKIFAWKAFIINANWFDIPIYVKTFIKSGLFWGHCIYFGLFMQTDYHDPNT